MCNVEECAPTYLECIELLLQLELVALQLLLLLPLPLGPLLPQQLVARRLPLLEEPAPLLLAETQTDEVKNSVNLKIFLPS